MIETIAEESFEKVINKLTNIVYYHDIKNAEQLKEHIYTRNYDESVIVVLKQSFELLYCALKKKKQPIVDNSSDYDEESQFISIRKKLYEISKKSVEEREEFLDIIKEYLEDKTDIKLPIQLIELVFEFDFHRGAIHPFPSALITKFKKKGLRLTKIRNHYTARIQNIIPRK